MSESIKLSAILKSFNRSDYLDVLKRASLIKSEKLTKKEKVKLSQIIGLTQIKLKNYKSAIEVLRVALDEEPNNVTVKRLLAKSFSMGGHYPTAQILYEEMLEVEITEGLLTEAAFNALRSENYGKAIILSKSATDLAPKSSRPWLISAHAHLEIHEYKSAREHIETAFRLDPVSIPIIQMFSKISIATEDLETARKMNEKALSIRDNYIDQWNLAYSLHGLGKYDDSITKNKIILQKFLRDPNLFSNSKKTTSSRNETDLRTTLFAFDEAMKNLKIPYLLLAGTLLGLHRDGKFLKNEKDIDVGLPWNTPRENLIDALKLYGFTAPSESLVRKSETDRWLIPIIFKATNVPIDLFFMKKEKDYINIGSDYVPPFLWQLKPFTPEKRNYLGREFLVPNPIDAYLQNFYGPEWREPQHYCVVLRGNALKPGNEKASISFGYNSLLALLRKGNYPKAYKYIKQMQLVCDDKILEDAVAMVHDLQKEHKSD